MGHLKFLVEDPKTQSQLLLKHELEFLVKRKGTLDLSYFTVVDLLLCLVMLTSVAAEVLPVSSG